LEWSLKPAVQNREWLLQVSEEAGTPLPSVLANQPILYSFLEWVWEAFSELNSYRTFSGTMAGMIPNPLALSEIRVYAEINGIDGEDFTDLLYYVKELDSEWCRKYLESLKSKSK
jgi:hypothetical protein